MLTPRGRGAPPVFLPWIKSQAVVPTRAEHYRLKAQECAERAKLARDPDAKRTSEDLARQWFILAKRAEEGGGGS